MEADALRHADCIRGVVGWGDGLLWAVLCFQAMVTASGIVGGQVLYPPLKKNLGISGPLVASVFGVGTRDFVNQMARVQLLVADSEAILAQRWLGSEAVRSTVLVAQPTEEDFHRDGDEAVAIVYQLGGVHADGACGGGGADVFPVLMPRFCTMPVSGAIDARVWKKQRRSSADVSPADEVALPLKVRCKGWRRYR